MKTLKLLCFCALYLLVQSCSKKENSIILNSSKLNSKKAIQWTLGSPLVNGVYSFQNPNGNTFQGDSQTAGSLVQAYTNSTGWPPQDWEVTCLGDVWGVPIYSIINHYSGLALGVVGSSTAQNAQIDQETYTQAANQIWGITIIGWGQYEIWNTHSGLALVIPGDVTTQGTDLVQETYSNPSVSAQDWEPTLLTTVDSASVDFSNTSGGAIKHVASGFLHGFAYSGGTLIPPDSLITPLQMNTVRQAEWYNWTGFLPAIAAKGIKQEIVVSDSWPYGYNDSNAAHAPGYQGNWALWDTTVRNVVNGARAAVGSGYYSTLSYDIYNEANLNWHYTGYTFPNAFFAAWKHAYQAIRTIDPTAVIVGPSYDDNDIGLLEGFLDYCQTNNVVPTYLSWHFSKNPTSEISTLNTYMSTHGITGVSGFQINEYCTHTDEYAGMNAWWIAQLERAKVNAAMHAIWGSEGTGANFGQLSGILTAPDSGLMKKATWWVYKAYGDINGNILGSTPGAKVDLIAGLNTSPTKYVNMLVGTYAGLAAGIIKVTCKNISSAFSGRTTLTVTLKVIANNNDAVVTNIAPYYVENVPVVNNSISIYIPCGGDKDAYEVNIQ